IARKTQSCSGESIFIATQLISGVAVGAQGLEGHAPRGRSAAERRPPTSYTDVALTSAAAIRLYRAMARGGAAWRRMATAASASVVMLCIGGGFGGTAWAVTYTVPDDFATIQAALNAAQAGDLVEARQQPTPYHEKTSFPRSGNAVNGFITLQNVAGDQPVLDGTGVPGANMVFIEDRSYVKLIGFEIRNNLVVNDGSGVRIQGAGSHIELRNNRIHDM